MKPRFDLITFQKLRKIVKNVHRLVPPGIEFKTVKQPSVPDDRDSPHLVLKCELKPSNSVDTRDNGFAAFWKELVIHRCAG